VLCVSAVRGFAVDITAETQRTPRIRREKLRMHSRTLQTKCGRS
jgi:hypothetical protein